MNYRSEDVSLGNVAQNGCVYGLDCANFASDCPALATRKYPEPVSSYMAARLKAGYFSPEDHYEALINRIITKDLSWLDVGCGRSPFPNNANLAAELSTRCRRFVGIDPDPSINDNKFVHEQHQLALESYVPSGHFDVVTARMVIEHVEQPRKFAADLSRITNFGSVVVLFTVNWWSITSLAASFSPMWMHHRLKSWLWKTNAQDTFKTEYKMNDRATLNSVMTKFGFTECLYLVLADASLFWRIPYIRRCELELYKFARRIGLPYLDTCILAAYRRL